MHRHVFPTCYRNGQPIALAVMQHSGRRSVPGRVRKEAIRTISARCVRAESGDRIAESLGGSGSGVIAVVQEALASRRDTYVTFLQLMLLPSAAAGAVLFACVIVQSVRREW